VFSSGIDSITLELDETRVFCPACGAPILRLAMGAGMSQTALAALARNLEFDMRQVGSLCLDFYAVLC
jgi:hypothetical protein